jgi:type IV pilus assembly protein PilA
MKHNKFQPGFTLIELIAVMVILAILAAVVIPRITSVQEGAYESNVGNMYGAIRNYVSNQALKNAISGGRGMETYDEPALVAATQLQNYYLDLWIKDYDKDKWIQTWENDGGVDENPTGPAVVGDRVASPNLIVFQYHPHGLTAGAGTIKKNVFFIEYFPATTQTAEDDGYQFDSFQLVAYKDDDDLGATGTDQDCDLGFDTTKDVVVSGMHKYRPDANLDVEATTVGTR